MASLQNRVTLFKNKLFDAYVRTPFFYKVYVITNGITYFYFPEMHNEILINTGILLGSQIIEFMEKYVKNKYPNKIFICDILNTLCVISKIGAFWHVSKSLEKFALLNNPFVGFGYNLNSQLLKYISNSAYYSALFGSVFSFVSWCVIKIFRNAISSFPEIINSNVRQLINTIRSNRSDRLASQTNQTNNQSNDEIELNEFITGSGPINQLIASISETINNSLPVPKKVLTLEKLNIISPLKCIGFANCDKYKNSISCSVCLEEFDEKTLHRTLPCEHSYHPHCIENWLINSSNTCPFCRKVVE